VFLHLKTFLGGRWLHDDKVKDAVNTWFALQVASFYDAGIQELVTCYDKCLNNGGNYVEKWCKVCTSDGNINGLEINCFCFNSPSELTFWITYVQLLPCDLLSFVFHNYMKLFLLSNPCWSFRFKSNKVEECYFWWNERTVTCLLNMKSIIRPTISSYWYTSIS
jgi:hypothetical protein